MQVPRLRSDALRNREAILCAAARAYSEGGADVSLEEVARLAQVGVATVYRRFPTKEALLAAVFETKMTEYAEHTQALANRARDRPAQAFEEHVRYIARAQQDDLAFSQVLREHSGASDLFREQHQRAFCSATTLVDRALAAGAVRSDFRMRDLLMLLDANHGVLERGGDDAIETSRRLCDALLAFAFDR